LDGTSPHSSDSGSMGPIRTGQDVPGSITYGQRAACSATRAVCKGEAQFGKGKETMVPSLTLVPIEEPIPVPDLTLILVPGVHTLSIEGGPITGPSMVAPLVLVDQMDTESETSHPTPDSPPYDPYSWENTHHEVGSWDHTLNPCADV